MGEQLKNLLIGIFVIAACVIIVWLILFLKPTVGDGKQTLYVRFSDINKVNVGTRVMFGGKPIGEVVAIETIQDARKKPLTDALGHLYFYQLTLKIDSHIKVYTTDKVAIQTSGLLGEKSISIIPEPAPKGVVPKLVSDQPIYAQSLDPIENAFVELTDLSNDMQVTFQNITAWIQKYGDDLGSTIRSVGGAMEEIKQTVHTINTLQIPADIKTALVNFNSTVLDVQKAIRTLDDGGTFVNAGIAMDHFKNASRSIEIITEDIAGGKGTLGRLIKNDDLYLRVTAIMSKIDTMMNDVNHYGILYHLNKGWQRQRAQRITELNALDTPQGFKTYFTDEVDEINTAMARLSMIINKAEQSPAKQEILKSDLFRKDFIDLLQQVNALSETLRLYNEQLMEAQGQ